MTQTKYADGLGKLEVRYENQRPVDLLDLTSSLAALGESYRDFVVGAGFDRTGSDVRLYVDRLERGSIVCVLQPLAEQAAFFADHVESVAAFATHINDIIDFFRRSRWSDDDAPSRAEAENLQKIVEPTAKDGGSQLFLNVAGDMHVHLDSEGASALQNNVRRFLGPPLPSHAHFQGEALTIYQLRDDAKTTAGDRGVIEAFSDRPVAIHFMTETAKRAVTERPVSPFGLVFVVDGQVSFSGGRPAVYKIYHVHDWFPRPDADQAG
ncbi:MAG: hypothetical protein ACMVO3_23095 [Thalassobaculum sp.]